jgi:hypothetical protein
MPTYRGRCHCGALRYVLRSDEITAGIRCNCSYCSRKGAVMSLQYYPPADFEELQGLDRLAVYRWGDGLVNNYFCKTCGIYPFHDISGKPGHYRVNLGCIDGLDPLALRIELVDGKSY